MGFEAGDPGGDACGVGEDGPGLGEYLLPGGPVVVGPDRGGQPGWQSAATIVASSMAAVPRRAVVCPAAMMWSPASWMGSTVSGLVAARSAAAQRMRATLPSAAAVTV
ncbi:hypothetical protein C5O27_16350 [Gordonia alkanivorans]|nr:hypothetical protein C5O27_16350 [Gordonia alkanivorans]